MNRLLHLDSTTSERYISSKTGLVLILLLLFFSGNVQLRQFNYAYLFLAISSIILFNKYLTIKTLKFIFLLFLLMMTIFTIQYSFFGYINILGVLNMFAKILFAFIVVKSNGRYFINRLLLALFYLSVISLVFFFADVLVGGLYKYFPALFVEESKHFYIFYYSFEDPYKSIIRNPGIFWEPGVFSNYLIICLLFALPYYGRMTNRKKIQIITIIITVLTTKSTTGYILLVAIIGMNLLLANKKYYAKYFFISILVVSSFYTYKGYWILGEKIKSQYENALFYQGAYDATRFGALMFDLHYIKKHPLFGNGLHAKTRYADHPSLQLEAEYLGHGNGLSQFIVSYGLVFVLIFMFVVYRRLYDIYRINNYALFGMIVLSLNLTGEPLINYPFYWSILLISGERMKNVLNNHDTQ